MRARNVKKGMSVQFDFGGTYYGIATGCKCKYPLNRYIYCEIVLTDGYKQYISSRRIQPYIKGEQI